MTQQDMIEAAREIAVRHGIAPRLFCALVETESSWIPWAIRYEPAFYVRYVAPSVPDGTEARARSFSWGLCQIMGQTARELGYTGALAELLNPEVGLEWGAVKLKDCLNRSAGDERQALLRYNGGADTGYPDRVLSKTGNYAFTA